MSFDHIYTQFKVLKDTLDDGNATIADITTQSQEVSDLIDIIKQEYDKICEIYNDYMYKINKRVETLNLQKIREEYEKFDDMYNLVNYNIRVLECDINKYCKIFNDGDISRNEFNTQTTELMNAIKRYIDGKNNEGAFINHIQSICPCPHDERTKTIGYIEMPFEQYKRLNRALSCNGSTARLYNYDCCRCTKICCNLCHKFIKTELCDDCMNYA